MWILIMPLLRLCSGDESTSRISLAADDDGDGDAASTSPAPDILLALSCVARTWSMRAL